MSRLQPLHIPFVQGYSDEVDEKLLPNGVFADVQNGRLPQRGSLRLRRGWRPVTMAELAGGTTLSMIDLYSYGDSLVGLSLRASSQALCLATLTQSNANRPWVLDGDSALPPATQVRAVGNMPALDTSMARASAALTADGVYGCVLQQSATESVFRVFVRDTDETVAYGELSNGSRVRKVVSMGTTFGLVENTGAGLALYSLDPTATAPAWASVATLFAATVTWFDAAVAFDTTPTALHIADVVAGEASYRQFTFAGVQTGSTKQLVAADAQAVALCSNDVVVEAVHQLITGAELELTSFSATPPFTTAAGPTAVNAGVDVVQGLFCVGMRGSAASSNPTVVVASEHLSLTDQIEFSTNTLTHATHAGNVRVQALGYQLCSGFLMRNFVSAVGATRRPEQTGLVNGATSMYLDAATTPWFYVDFGIASQRRPTAEPPLWPAQCPTGDALVLLPRDTTTASANVESKGLTVRAVKVRTSERRPAAQLGGALYITGGVLTQWVGAASDNGMLAPIIQTAAGTSDSGSVAAGTYQARAVVVWEDEKQRTHRSVVSNAEEFTIGGGSDTVVYTVYAPKTLRRNNNLVTNPRVEVYRTEVGPGELFYLVGSEPVGTFDDEVEIEDHFADASIIDEPQLYTQGEFGATSGVLDMAPARPASFIAGTKRRLLLGSADTSYQWSQATFPEIPVWFAEPGVSGDAAQAYFDDVEGGRITGVAALDEVAFVGTRERIYVAGGTGPNLAGVGEFDAPHRLPADVGFYAAASLLETSEGLWFQGSAAGMYLLPRGQASPVLDDSVQDHLTAGIVGAGYDATDDVAVWAMSGATALVRHLGFKLWVGDALPFTPIALVGHRGQLYAIASDGVVWQQHATAFGDGASGATAVALRVATGQIGPFEMAGHGRLAVVELLGEFQAAAAILAEISYDDGVSWTSLGTHTITGLTVGAAFQRQWYPVRQRGDRFRVRFTMTPSVSTTEGCRLTGCTVYYAKRSGPTRLDSAKRR